MDLHDLFEKHLQRIDMLNDFIVLYGKKEETVSDLRAISKVNGNCNFCILRIDLKIIGNRKISKK